MFRVSLIEKEFLSDTLEFLKLKYNISISVLRGERVLPNESIEDVLYREVDRYVLKKLYKIGQEDYNIELSYQEFLVALLDGYTTKAPPFFRLRTWGLCKPSKYQKKPHHKKKEKTLEEIDRENWRRSKIKKRSCYSRHYYDYDWEEKKAENDRKLHAMNDLDDFLENVDIDTKGLKLSL